MATCFTRERVFVEVGLVGGHLKTHTSISNNLLFPILSFFLSFLFFHSYINFGPAGPLKREKDRERERERVWWWCGLFLCF